MATLLLFNRAPTWTLARIAAETGIPRGELSRHVLSLATPKLRILNKEAKGRELGDDEPLAVNDEFVSRLFRVKVPLIAAKSLAGAGGGAGGARGGAGGAGGADGGGAAGSSASAAGAADEDGGDIAAQIENQRKSMLEAAIVRIMKARRSLDHSNLIAEVTRQVSSRFRPTPADIKRRIEDLVERD
jgi:cullin 3